MWTGSPPWASLHQLTIRTSHPRHSHRYFIWLTHQLRAPSLVTLGYVKLTTKASWSTREQPWGTQPGSQSRNLLWESWSDFDNLLCPLWHEVSTKWILCAACLMCKGMNTWLHTCVCVSGYVHALFPALFLALCRLHRAFSSFSHLPLGTAYFKLSCALVMHFIILPCLFIILNSRLPGSLSLSCSFFWAGFLSLTLFLSSPQPCSLRWHAYHQPVASYLIF